MKQKLKATHQWRRLKRDDILRKVIRTVCVYHRKPMLSATLTQVAIEYITAKLPVRPLRRLLKDEGDHCFVQAMLLATPFVT